MCPWPPVDLNSFILESCHAVLVSEILSLYFCSTVLLGFTFEFFNTSNLWHRETLKKVPELENVHLRCDIWLLKPLFQFIANSKSSIAIKYRLKYFNFSLKGWGITYTLITPESNTWTSPFSIFTSPRWWKKDCEHLNVHFFS